MCQSNERTGKGKIMPTENERKYVLDFSFVPAFREFAAANPMTVNGPISISQGYLYADDKLGVRIRKEHFYPDGNDHTKYMFCAKQNVGHRVIEIEQQIDQRDFDELWEMTQGQFFKERWRFHNWDIDFFKYYTGIGGTTYIIVAEIEMPESQLTPTTIPDIISDYMLYAVPLEEQHKFSSAKLASIEYAQKLYRTLENKDVNK